MNSRQNSRVSWLAYPRPRSLRLSSADIWGQQLFAGGPLFTVGCPVPSLASTHQVPIESSPPGETTKNVPRPYPLFPGDKPGDKSTKLRQVCPTPSVSARGQVFALDISLECIVSCTENAACAQRLRKRGSGPEHRLWVPQAADQHSAGSVEFDHLRNPVKQELLSPDFINEETEDLQDSPGHEH